MCGFQVARLSPMSAIGETGGPGGSSPADASANAGRRDDIRVSGWLAVCLVALLMFPAAHAKKAAAWVHAETDAERIDALVPGAKISIFVDPEAASATLDQEIATAIANVLRVKGYVLVSSDDAQLTNQRDNRRASRDAQQTDHRQTLPSSSPVPPRLEPLAVLDHS